MKLKSRFTKIATTLALTLGASLSAHAIVYTASNEVHSNDIIAFDVDEDAGRLIEVGRFPTGGTGTGGPLGNQSAIATDASDRWLFATNAGDGTLTSFRLQPDGLQFVDKLPSGGHSAISVTVYGTLIYVLNEGSGDEADPPRVRFDNITGFRFTDGGKLVPVLGSTRVLDRTQLTAPAQVGFNKSGTVLLITEKATNTITTYRVRRTGRTAFRPLKRPSAVPTPFGFEFGDRDYVFITEANGGAQGVTASYRVDRETGEVSSLVDLIDQGDATCWTVLNHDQTIGYSVNTGSGSISPYNINFNGTLEPFFENNPNRTVRTGDAPRDAVLSQDNRYLFVLANGDSEMDLFLVRRNGSLKWADSADVPASVTGVMAR